MVEHGIDVRDSQSYELRTSRTAGSDGEIVASANDIDVVVYVCNRTARLDRSVPGDSIDNSWFGTSEVAHGVEECVC